MSTGAEVNAGTTPRQERFSRFARAVSTKLAHPAAFVVAVMTILVWAGFGPILHYSATWLLAINTGATILTFLMVFVLQNTQNRNARATQIKLDELLRALSGARNELISLENLSEADLHHYGQEFQHLQTHHAQMAAAAKRRPTDRVPEQGRANDEAPPG